MGFEGQLRGWQSMTELRIVSKRSARQALKKKENEELHTKFQKELNDILSKYF